MQRSIGLAVLDRVLDERLHEQRRQPDRERGGIGVDRHVELRVRTGPAPARGSCGRGRSSSSRVTNSPGRASRAAQMVGEREHELPRAFGIGADERRDRVQRVEDEMRLHLRLQRRGRRRAQLGELQLRGELVAERLECLRPPSRRAAIRPSRTRRPRPPARRRVRAARRPRRRADRRGGGTRLRIPSGASSGRSWASASYTGRIGWSPGRMVVGAGADEGEHPLGVGDGDGAVAELLEQLVGDGARRSLGQTAPKLGQRRREQLEHRRPAPRPAHAGHDRIVHITDAILAAAARAVRAARAARMARRDHRARSTRSRPTTRSAVTTSRCSSSTRPNASP